MFVPEIDDFLEKESLLQHADDRPRGVIIHPDGANALRLLIIGHDPGISFIKYVNVNERVLVYSTIRVCEGANRWTLHLTKGTCFFAPLLFCPIVLTKGADNPR